MAALDDLRAQVEQTASVIDSAVALINGIAEKVAASKDQAMKDLADELKSKSSLLATAVTANTPIGSPVGPGAPPAPPITVQPGKP
jgi:hypothetical protein